MITMMCKHWSWQVKEKQCVDQKIALIRANEKVEKKVMLGDVLDSAHSLSLILFGKIRKIILQDETEGSSCKRIRKPKFEELDQAMLIWFQKQCCNNVTISGLILKT